LNFAISFPPILEVDNVITVDIRSLNLR